VTESKTNETQAPIYRYLCLMRDRGASDLHLSVGRAPALRVAGRLDPLRSHVLTDRDYAELVEPMTPEHLWQRFQATGDVDFAYEVAGLARFRVNLFRHVRGAGAVLRLIPERPVTLRQMGLPASVRKIVSLPDGLVLVTGPTGSGKSTTLAAIVHEINKTRNLHIITIEDPIEFVHENDRAMISQREIGTDAHSFADALHGALREDPDAILIGEMKDTETIEMALTAAEAGVLVLGTLHTSSAAKAIDRIVGAFPERQQAGARSMLSSALKGIVAQQLVPRKGGGSVPAFEILFGTPALGTLIRASKTHLVGDVIASGKGAGMIRMDDSLLELVAQDMVSADDALELAVDRDAMAKALASG
jgi:twitching motility protein PilT